MFKRAKVVMLPTNEKATLKSDLAINENNLLFQPSKLEGTWFFLNKFQHLYILSDDKIKGGDWCIGNDKIHAKSPDEFFIAQCTSVVNGWIYLKDHEGEGNNPDYTKKVIASTDRLPLNSIINNSKLFLPEPSQSFIEKYITEYNKGNIITDVLVEYETNNIHNQEIMFHEERKEFFFEDYIDEKFTTIYLKEKLKINPKDNTITIKKVKDSYSREEVEKLIYRAIVSVSPNPAKGFIDKWIEENL